MSGVDLKKFKNSTSNIFKARLCNSLEKRLCLCVRDHLGLMDSVFAVDWIIADILAVRQNALGHVRYVLKDGLKWLPLYGCYFSQVLFSMLLSICMDVLSFLGLFLMGLPVHSKLMWFYLAFLMVCVYIYMSDYPNC